MLIHWYGHAAFRIETRGRRIILDPYRSPDSGGYGPIDEPADLVIVSHQNDRYHSHLGQIVPPFRVVPGLMVPPEGTDAAGLRIDAIPVYETPEKRIGDEVTIVHFRSEGLHVVSLGDLGHLLSPEEVEPIRGADVLLVAAGGPPTIDLPDVPALLEAIGPRLVVPMHYFLPGKINLKIRPVEDFLKVLPGWKVERLNGPDIEIDPGRLPSGRRIVVPRPSR